jgi:hypothetical protein
MHRPQSVIFFHLGLCSPSYYIGMQTEMYEAAAPDCMEYDPKIGCHVD